MDLQTVETFRRKLRDRDATLRRRRSSLLFDAPDLRQSRAPDWGHVAADRSTATRLDAVTDRYARELVQIQRSLERLDDGTFGYCVVCHAPIENERLRAMPEVERCSGCTH